MTALAVVCGACAILVVVLAYLVGRLHREVRKLTDQVATMGASASAPPLAGDNTTGESTPTSPGAEAISRASLVAVELPRPHGEDAPEAIAVITAMSDGSDELDITRARVASVTLARPLIKVAAFSYGVRRALGDEPRFKVRYAMRQELRRQRKMRRRRKSGRAPSKRWES